MSASQRLFVDWPVRPSRGDTLFRLLTITLAMLAIGVGFQPYWAPTAAQQASREFRSALAARQFAAAEQAAERYAQHVGDTPTSVLFRAEAASGLLKDEAAIDYYRRVPKESAEYVPAMLGLGRRFVMLEQLSQAEAAYRAVLTVEPDHVDAHRQLLKLLYIEARVFEAAIHGLRLLQLGEISRDALGPVGAIDHFLLMGKEIEKAQQLRPDDYRLRLPIAMLTTTGGSMKDLAGELQAIVNHEPEVWEAHALLADQLAGQQRLEELRQLARGWPREDIPRAALWRAKAVVAERLGEPALAVGCLRRALELAPSSVPVHVQLASALAKAGHADLAKQFSEYAARVHSIDVWSNVMLQRPDQSILPKLLPALEQSGRHLEAVAWATVMAQQTGDRRLLETAVEQKRRLDPGRHQVHPSQDLTRLLRAEDFPLDRWDELLAKPIGSPAVAPIDSSDTDSLANMESDDSGWHFTEDSQALGIRFVYDEGSSDADRLRQIVTSLGGGVAAFDFDRDGWTDLGFAQGGPWQQANLGQPMPITDQLYRNLGGQRFVDVSTAAGLLERGFTLSWAVGDYNADGFPDVYAANFGANTLWQNQGDGTWVQVPLSADVAGLEWSTSCGWADLNHDGLPELFVTNYLEREEAATQICRKEDGSMSTCSPTLLTAELDRLYVNRGQGEFQEITATAGLNVPGGKGLGVVIADFERRGQLDLFVGNDLMPNFLFRAEPVAAGELPRFTEEGVQRGVAFDDRGNAQACMGIACEDLSGDGRLDLFVTNFYRESNALYVQHPEGEFTYESQSAGIFTPSYMMLGFGTQALDVDADGWNDLVVANGHVTQGEIERGQDDRMPPQAFRNLGRGQFREIAAEGLGSYFQGKWLGRGLSTLDWNRDGRIDFVVSQIHDPAQLVTNQTAPRGPLLQLELIGTGRSERLPIGTRVIARSGDLTIERQLTGGGGYLASNEPLVVLTGCPRDRWEEVVIHWPSGAVTRTVDQPASGRWIVREGQSDWIRDEVSPPAKPPAEPDAADPVSAVSP